LHFPYKGQDKWPDHWKWRRGGEGRSVAKLIKVNRRENAIKLCTEIVGITKE
jgi:hypothetical protein